MAHLGVIGEFGPAGVDLFFVISGFIITSVSTGATAAEFLARRLTRILPLYWLLTGAMMAIYMAVGEFDPHQMLASFLFVPTLNYSSYIISGWTLCFEILFYICFSAVLYSPKRGMPIAVGIYIAAVFGREVLGGPVLQFIGNPMILEFLAGCLIAVLPRSRTAALLSAASAVAWGVIIVATGYEAGAHQSPFSGDAIWFRVLMWGAPAAFLVYAAVQMRLAGRVCDVLAYLGDASFSAYLIHDFVRILLVLVHDLISPVIGVLLTIVVSWLLAVILYEGLERPLLKLFRRPKPARADLLVRQ